MSDLIRVTSGRTDPMLAGILVDNSKDTVFWMNRDRRREDGTRHHHRRRARKATS